jgi:hypothetical protein
MRRSETHFSQMTWIVLAFFAVFFLWICPAPAQTWSCTINGSACQPGTAGCTCAEVPQAPAVVAPPSCPFGTYWNGGVCVQIQQAPVYIPPPVYYQHPYNPYGNIPFNQQPGWPHPH